ncbi:MAG TPA: hypothetical protein VK859_12785, partial [bacterium]|nr:hypothetical protein [bacterium]
MNLIRHMLKKDIRRFRLPITCGLLIAGLPVLLGILDVQLASKDIQLHALLLKLYFWAAWAQAFFVILMTGIARGEESPSSTTAFWMTRPISPGMVLKAKALFFGIFLVLVPLLSQSLLLALEGVTVRDIAYADLEMAFRLSESIALAWLLAAVTSNYGRFLIAAALVFPLQWLSGCWMLIWKTLYTQSATPFRATALIVSDSIVVAALTILGGAFLIIHQYRTRDTHRTVYSALAGLALLFLVQPLWKWNLQKPSIPRGAGESVSLSLGKYTVARRSGDWTSPKPVMEYWGDLEFAGRNPGDDIRVMGLSTTLVLPDGKTLQDEGFDIDPGYKWFNSPNPQTAQEALGP